MVPRARTDGRQRRLIVLVGLATAVVLAGALWTFNALAREPARPNTASAVPAPIAPVPEPSAIEQDREPVSPSAPEPMASAELPLPAPLRTETPTLGLVVGHVSDEHGAPIVGVTIEAWRAADFAAAEAYHGDQADAPVPVSTVTDNAGGFSFRLTPETYAFAYGDAHFALPNTAPQRVGAAAVDLAVTLPELGSLELTVRGDEGAIVPDIAVRGTGKDAGVLRLRTDASGKARAQYLPPGEYHLFADANKVGRGSLSFELQPHAEAHIELLLRSRAIR